MSDLISRQDAIDAAIEAADDWDGGCSKERERFIRDALEALPSAQPELCEDAVSRRRLLSDLKELIAAWEKYPVMAEQRKGVEAAIGYVAVIPSVTPKPEQRWIPCKERLPEEDNWLGGSGKQFSDHVLISILNSDDEDEWVNVSCTIDGKWAFELPRHCKILAWMPLPEPYKERREEE